MSDTNAAKLAFNQTARWLKTQVAPIAQKHPQQLEDWNREMRAIREQLANTDSVRVALVGTTGAGKSTFLNAVLGHELLPVGVMEPCTAFVTLVRYHAHSAYRVTVDFVTPTEWRRDLETLRALLTPTIDPDADMSETKRLLTAAKKRVQAVLGIEITDQTDLAKQALPPEAKAIFKEASSQQHEFDTVKEMQQHLRGFIRGDSPLWPLVKQVTISGPYTFLKGGIELVDLPGLNDPNEARIEVTREYLRTTPFVWVMFPMVRGLTHDIQAILHEEKLLRTLVMTGSYAALSLIGTKADDIDANIAVQLGLDEDAELPEIIAAYRKQTIEKARDQLSSMVRDLSTSNDSATSDSSDTVERMLSVTRQIQVHATSAAAYCRLRGIGRLRRDYGIPELEETGIPGIHRLLEQIDREVGARFAAQIALRRIEQLCNDVQFFFRGHQQTARPDLERASASLNQELQRLETRVSKAASEATLHYALHREAFLGKVDTLLEQSVLEVKRACQTWQGIHWATLKAVVTNDGVFRSPSTGKTYDLNADITEPLLNQLPVLWERYFTDDLGRVRDQFVDRLRGSTTDFGERATLTLEEALGRYDTMLQKQLESFHDKVKFLVQQADTQLKSEISARRRDLSNAIPNAVKTKMQPAYAAARDEVGAGMKTRVVQLLERSAVQTAPEMYDAIRQELLEGLTGLEQIAQRILQQLALTANQQAGNIAQNAAIDMNEAAVDPAIRDLLLGMPKVSK